jgi:hypothetical protein
MNEEAIKDAYGLFANTGYNGSYDDFKQLIQSNPEARSDAYGLFTGTGYNGSQQDFDSLMGIGASEPVKKKEESSVPLWLQKQEQPKPKQEQTLPFLESKPSGISLGSQRVPETAPMFEAPPMRTPEQAQAIVEAPEYREAKYFEGTFGELLSNMDNPAISPNTAWIGMGDFVDDFGRAIGQGSKTGDIVAPTSKIFLNGAKTSDEDIEKFRQASELADKLGPSDEMFRFANEYQESGKTVSGFLKALANNPGAIPEIMVSSYSAMINSTSLAAGGSVVAGGAATGAATGAAAGGVGAIPGAVAGAVASIPYAMAAMGATLETNLSLAESIKDKLAQDGLEWNDENIKSVISDEKFLKDARVKAATRGVTIGAIDALTGRIAGKVGAKLLKAPKGGAVKSAVAAGSIEAAGGSTGEATTRALTGQEMDIAEIGLEGIAELPGTVVSVGSEVLKKPLYKVNGEIRPESDVKEIVETADGDQLAKINIEITNDDKGYNEQIQEKVVSAQVKKEVKEVNPDLDEETADEITRLEMQLKKVEGKKTQTAKDKAADIRSQIKTLQENAIQKPSTEESVLRAEESQVGLQEVGEGNAQVEAPTEEVVQEEVATTDEELQAVFDRIEIPEDTEAVAEQPILSEESQKVKTQLEDFQNSFDEAYNTEYPKSGTAQQKRSSTAKSKKAVNKLQQMMGFDIGAYWELDANQTKKREALYSLRENKDYDSYDQMVAAYQKDVAEGNQSELVTSINTLLGIAPIEVAAPVAKATPKVSSKTQGKTTFIKKPRKINDNLYEFEDTIGVGYIAKKQVGEDAKPRWIVVDSPESFEFDHTPFTSLKDAVNYVEQSNRKVSEMKAKSVPIPVAIPKPTAPAPKPVAVVSQPQEDVKIYSYNGRNYEIKRLSVKEVGTDKGLPLEFGKIIKAEGKLLTPATPVVAKAKAAPKAKVEPVKVVPTIVSKPVIASKPVIVPASTTIVGPVQLKEAHMASVNAVRIDQTLTQRQKDAKVDALKVEYQARKAEMESAAPAVAKPKTEAKSSVKAAPKKAAPAPKVEAKAEPVVKSKFQQAQDFADKLSAMSQEERDDVEFNENYRGYQLFEARKAMPKTPNSPKFKKVDENNSSTLYSDYEYIANIDGEPYGLMKYEDPDDPDNDKAFVWAYEKVGTDDVLETMIFDNEELIKEIKSQISKEVKTTPKAEPTSVVEEDEPSYEDIKDLDVSDPTFLETVEDFLDDMEDGLENFGRGNLSSGIAIPLAKAIIKSLKVLVRAGITLQEAIKRVAADNNVEIKDIVSMIKQLDKSQSPIVKLKDQIKSEARAALNAKKDINQKRKDLSNTIKEMETTGKISAAKAKAILNKIGKVNLDNPAAVDTFLDYVENVFENAEYEVELAGINAKLGKAKNNVNKKIGTAKNLTPVLNKLFNIKPSLIPSELLDAYKNLVDMFGDNAAVLDLAEITEVTKQAQEILNKIDDQLSTVPALATKLFNYEKGVLGEDGALDYSATIEKMLSDEVIDEAEYKLMKKYKSLILPRAVKIPKTKQELADEKKVLVTQVKKAASEVTISELASDDEKKMASNIIKLAKTNAVEALDNRQLENLLKIFDNFSNGYFPAYANGLSNDLIAGENATFLSKAIAKAKMPTLASVKLKLRNKRKALFAKVKSSPLFNIDEIFGDFKTKDIFNSIFNALAQNQQRYTLEIEKINQRLEDALNKIAKTYNNNENKIVESKMKMAIYRIQREFQSNPGDSRVNPAIEYINKTIEAIREGDTNYSEEDADMLEQIAKDYSDGKKPSGIDATKLKESFNSAELEALDVFDKVNQELEDKAIFTGDVIRGDKVYLLNEYNHVSVLPKKNENPDTIADAMSKFDPKNVVSTKAKSLIERTSGAKPINFDIFSTVQRGANFVLMDYYLTNPVRIARKSINAASKMIEENGTLNENTKTIVNVLKDSVELALKASLDQAVVKDTFADKVIKEMAKTGYRAMLGGIPRATTEFTSNMAYVAMVAPKEWATGVKMMKVIRGGKAVNIMEAVGSKVISRVYGTDPLKGRLVDPSVLSKRVGIGASKLKGETLNVISTIHNNTTKKLKNFAEFLADGLISTPDKIMMRPLWFGAFDKAFEDLSGKKPDYDKIGANDADYMIKNKESLDAAGRVADEKVTMAGNVDNPYMNALRTNISSDMSGLVKTFKVFDNFMLKFQIGEYLTARRGIYAMMGNGNISKEQGARLMAAVVTRMTVYTVMSKMAAEFFYGLFLDDEDEDNDKSFAQKLGQGLASTFTSLLLGRDLGNATRSVVNYGVEKVNENYLEFLRDGEYDPYEDAIQYTFIPPEKKGKSLEAFDVIANISGPYSPALKSLNFVTKKLTEEPKKEAAAIERQDSEKALRIPLEILGNLGYVPLYKDIRAYVNKTIYSELDKELDQQGQKGEEFKPMGMNKTDLERYYPEIYEQYYGEGSKAEAERKLEYEKNLLERKMKDDYYNYVPKQRPKKGAINRRGINRGGINRGSRGSK